MSEFEKALKAIQAVAATSATEIEKFSVKFEQPNCCCQYGAAVSGEYPELGCARCPVHRAALDETELCRRHATMKA